MTGLSLVISFALFSAFHFTLGKPPIQIGIIGGGIGGTACAFFLKSLLGKENILLDLYEADNVGGRLSLVNFSSGLYEEGGSIIHARNKYMVQFLKEFNFDKRQSFDGHFGLYNGQDFVFSESEWQLKTLWNVITRYGLGVWKLKTLIEEMLQKFERIYEMQNKEETFETVDKMMAAIDPKFLKNLRISTKEGFKSQGVSDIVINEIILATIRANYGQNLNIHKMVGSVSVAGAVGDLWSVQGGNVRIPQALLRASKAKLIQAAVTSVRKTPSGRLEVRTTSECKVRTYDVVILAAPRSPDAKYPINFENFDKDIKFGGNYHKTVCTFIEGSLSEEYFPEKKAVVDEILTTKELFFNSIGKVAPVDFVPGERSRPEVWKVFSQRKMTDDQTLSLFSDVKNQYVREWLAYPHYDTSRRNDSFVLAPNLYYVNAIEWAASAMEMSVIGAKNVALLVLKNYSTKSELDDKTSSLIKEDL